LAAIAPQAPSASGRLRKIARMIMFSAYSPAALQFQRRLDRSIKGKDS